MSLAMYTDPVEGGDLSAVTATPYSRAGVVLTAGTPVTLTVPTESIKIEYTGSTTEINGVNSPGVNNVEYARSANASISVYREHGSAKPDKLADLVATLAVGDILALSYTEKQGSGTRIVTVYGAFDKVTSGFDGRSKQVATLSIKSVSLSIASTPSGVNYGFATA